MLIGNKLIFKFQATRQAASIQLVQQTLHQACVGEDGKQYQENSREQYAPVHQRGELGAVIEHGVVKEKLQELRGAQGREHNQEVHRDELPGKFLSQPARRIAQEQQQLQAVPAARYDQLQVK